MYMALCIETLVLRSKRLAYLSENGITVNLLHTSLKNTGEGVLSGRSEGVEGRKEEECFFLYGGGQRDGLHKERCAKTVTTSHFPSVNCPC